MHGDVWDQQDDRLRQLWADRWPVKDIARVLGRTPPAVYVRARALGLPKRRMGRPVAEHARMQACLLDYVAEARTTLDVAAYFGWSVKLAGSRLAKLREQGQVVSDGGGERPDGCPCLLWRSIASSSLLPA